MLGNHEVVLIKKFREDSDRIIIQDKIIYRGSIEGAIKRMPIESKKGQYEILLSSQQRHQLKLGLSERTKIRRRKEQERRQQYYK